LERDPLDEQTWSDLDMDAVFARIDRTHSSVGQLVLVGFLRNPTRDEPILAERHRVIEIFRQHEAARDDVRLELARLGPTRHLATLVSLLWAEESADLRVSPWLAILAGLALPALLAPFYVGAAGLWLLIAVFSANYVVHYRTRFRFEPEIQALGYLGALLGTARRLARANLPGLTGHQDRLRDAGRGAGPILWRTALLPSGRPTDLLLEYLNILFLIEVLGLAKTLREVAARRPALRDAFAAVGELDALQSAASFRAGLPWFSTPTFVPGPVALDVLDLIHPLVQDAVPNSIRLQARGALVTGSNMSGKSTFLRALGVNAILAETLYTCTARRYAASALRVVASLRVSDDLLRGKSLYLAEAERLLAIIRSVDGGGATLCLIDELLAGTNSAERLAASVEILAFLSRKGALLVAATHDPQLAAELSGILDGYHFQDDASPEGMRFDHCLRPGLATTRNAIRLLAMLGFPEEIVQGAAARVTATVPGK
jgi:DNA mismatch repair ATPase MutS